MFCQRKNFLAKKKEQNYTSFVLKFGTKKKIFYNYTNHFMFVNKLFLY